MLNQSRCGEYGYDAPYALIAFAGAGILAAAVAAVGWWTGASKFAAKALLYAGFFELNAASFLFTTRRGKFLVWTEILDQLGLRGDELVLDLGCGRGAVLTMVAQRLTSGRVTGIDLWSTHDQSGNAASVTKRNAELEGVSDRVTIETGDMRALPFPDAVFDVVVSSLAIHNIPAVADRQKAVAEAVRVLRPGGQIAIADIKSTRVYAGTLSALGLSQVRRRRLGWRFWYGNPFAATTLVTAVK